MERQAVFLNKAFAIVITLACLSSCKQARENGLVKIPTSYKSYTDPDLNKKQDTLYYRTQKYSGYVYELSDKHDTVLLFGYIDGLEEGVLKKWYPNRQLQEFRHYTAGKKKRNALWLVGERA